MDAAADLASRLGQALAPRYRLERELGRGGMAIVFLADDLKHGRPVALKVLRPELGLAVGVERFLREIQFAARLTHPNILPLHDSGEVDGLLYYVMPYVTGESLRDRLDRQGQLPVEEALTIIGEVADAITYAHSCGVIHRDLKPENILFAAGHAVVSDFGIARALGVANRAAVTETGLAVGTPTYMSPEQAGGGGALDGRSDVYALGCVTYEMLAGQPPFTGPTSLAILARHALDPVPPLRTLRPDVAEGLERGILKALAKIPADRFATAVAFVEALSRPVIAAPPVRSIAVLPFLNLGGDPENEYFADGITEDVIAQLSRIRALKVISRTSVMSFKQREVSVQEIASQLAVATVLEGSVRRAGERVRIVAQLIDAASGQHLWAETYDRELKDVFAIQSDVALRIATALEAELSPDEHAGLRDHATAARSPDPDAYESYLRGRVHWSKHTPESLRTALSYFRLALQRDPGFALAHGAVADTWGTQVFLGLVAPRDALPNFRAGVLKAMELDDTAAYIHDLMGRLRFWYEWDWKGAELSYQKAIQLSANHADVRLFYAWFLSAMQRWEEAASHLEQALELDPLNALFQWFAGFGLFLQRRHDEAIAQFRQTLQLDPGFLLARSGLASALHESQQYEAALTESKRYCEALKDREVLDALTRGFSEGGYPGSMAAAAAQLGVRASHTHVPPTQIARFHAYAGERDLALHWLERAHAERDFPMTYVRVDPTWQTLYSDPRLQDLVKRMMFPP